MKKVKKRFTDRLGDFFSAMRVIANKQFFKVGATSGFFLTNCNLKNETLTQVFSCKFHEISKNTFSYRKPRVAASEYLEFWNFLKK